MKLALIRERRKMKLSVVLWAVFTAMCLFCLYIGNPLAAIGFLFASTGCIIIRDGAKTYLETEDKDD